MNWFLEFCVRLVEVVKETAGAEALNKLEMMKVMEFWAVEEGQMVSAVVSEGGDDRYREPYPAGR